MKFNLYGFSNNAVHVSCFCGEYGGAIEMNTVFLVDAVLSTIAPAYSPQKQDTWTALLEKP
jgi:hypothetical protein